LKAKAAAEESLKHRQSDLDYARAQAELAQAVAQLRAVRRVRDTPTR
ncbi:MAG: F0F1 ATP synthase subunit epsilon, partial [Gammaproteobacteria bacterium]|nr:F0F1 ATP synthase subunit epsilon [Gammaproteobacteria bacterium]